MMISMPSLQIRDVPADVYEALAYRAERAGRSLAQQALIELREMAGGSASRRQAALDAAAARQAPRARRLPVPEQLVRRDRER